MGTSRNAVDYTGLFDQRPAPERYEQPEEDKILVQEINNWKRKCEDYRGGFETEWKLNSAFVQGDQLWGRHKLTGAILRLSPGDSKRVKVQNNMLRPVHRSLSGKLSAMIPTYAVQPATADFEERQGAIAGDAILQLVREMQDLDEKYAEACDYLPDHGNAFLYLTWDPRGGQDIACCDVCKYYTYDLSKLNTPCPNCTMQKQAEQQKQQLDTQAIQAEAAGDVLSQLPPEANISPQELMQGIQSPPSSPEQLGPLPPEESVPVLKEAKEGDAEVEVRSPFDVYLPPGIKKIKKVTRWMVRTPMEVSEACAMYPEFAPFFRAEAAVEMHQASITGPQQMTASENLDDHLWHYAIYEGPTNSYPHGRMIVMINDIIVDKRENPYWMFKRPNLFHFGFDRIKGKLYRAAPITDAIPRQRELNITETQKREAIDLALRRKQFVPIGSGISVTDLSSDTPQVIPYNPNAGNLAEWKGPELPQSFWQNKAELVQDMRMQMCVTDADQGMVGSDPNGRVMAILTAESDKQLGPIIRYNNSEYRDMHFDILLLYQAYANEERQASIPGKQGCTIVYFKELQLLKPGFRLRLEEEDGLSHNPAVRLQQAQNIFTTTSGQYFVDSLTGQFDKKSFARMAKLRVLDQGADKEATEQAAASKLPYMIQQGQQWKPRLFDVPQIWADTLEDWLRGPGRDAPMELSVQVEQVWLYYKQWAVSGAPPQMQQQGPQQPGQGPSTPGQQNSAPGGSPNSMGPTQSVGQEAEQKVQQADQHGEQLARQSAKREG